MIYINNKGAVYKDSAGILTTTSINYTGDSQEPISYINIAKTEAVAGCAEKVFINGSPMAHAQSYLAKSSGDEPGDGGGIYSGTINGKAEFMTSSPNVFVEGHGAVRSGDLMVSNHRNTNIAPLMQSDNALSSSQDKTTQNTSQQDQDCQLVDWQGNAAESFVTFG